MLTYRLATRLASATPRSLKPFKIYTVARAVEQWKLFERHWEQYTMMSATLPWLRSARVGTGGGLASPGYKMISLGYKFQAETPAARSPPFLLVTTLLRPLQPSASSSSSSLSPVSLSLTLSPCRHRRGKYIYHTASTE